MINVRTSYFGLLLIAAVVFGKGLHLVVSPEFWGPDSTIPRFEAVIRILLGITIYIFARRLKPSEIRHNSE